MAFNTRAEEKKFIESLNLGVILIRGLNCTTPGMRSRGLQKYEIISHTNPIEENFLSTEEKRIKTNLKGSMEEIVAAQGDA